MDLKQNLYAYARKQNRFSWIIWKGNDWYCLHDSHLHLILILQSRILCVRNLVSKIIVDSRNIPMVRVAVIRFDKRSVSNGSLWKTEMSDQNDII
jgi:hypothetical protein